MGVSDSVKVVTIILAAGSSTRMKSVKQLLPWKKTTLIGNTIEQLLLSGSNSIYVVLGANFELIKPEINGYHVEILNNKNWKSGIGSSIAFAIKYIIKNDQNVDGIMITLSDQPLINHLHYNELIHSFTQHSDL